MSYYHNTTNERASVVADQANKNKNQEEVILDMFHEKRFGMTAGYIAGSDEFPRTPITSIRRALNGLEKKGYLYRNGDKMEGMYGRNEYVYYLRSNPNVNTSDDNKLF